jgi:predicted small secreted protein
MKKLLLVLVVVAMASFLLTGCFGVPDGAEGEDEGEGETGVVVAIEDAVVVDGKTYVSCGTHTITVTFPAPVVGYADAWISICSGDYSPDGVYSKDMYDEGTTVVLFPDATRKVWTGSGYFGECNGGCTPCCASYVSIYAGECEDEACIWFPVIVDCCEPYAEIDISVDNCTCEDCKLTFESGVNTADCAPDEECCGDSCSGLASWSIVLYEDYPFDECCDPSICEEPIGSCSGTTCPIECTTECLSAGEYWAVVTLADAVGLETVYIAQIFIGGGADEDDTCTVVVAEYGPLASDPCVEFIETHDWVGTCEEVCSAY